MTLTPTITVDSQSIEEVTYSKDYASLYIKFRNGRVYVYRGVPEEVYFELTQSSSKGRYLNREIKNRFQYAEL